MTLCIASYEQHIYQDSHIWDYFHQLFSHLAYSSLMIFRTRLTMFPTVVSEGCAVIILLPSLRMISIRSPERYYISVEIQMQLKGGNKIIQQQ